LRKLSAFLRALRASVVNRFLIFYLCVSASLREEIWFLAKALSRKERIKGRIFYHPLRWRHRGHGVLKEEVEVYLEKTYQPFSVLSVPPW